MANVLPERAKKTMLREFATRFAIAGAVMLMGTAFIAFLALLPTEIVLQLDTASLQHISAASASPGQINADHATLADAASLVSTVLPFTNATSTGLEALRYALADKTPGISISSISYIPGSGTLSLTGSIMPGGSISGFQSALKADTHFTNVEIPVGTLVGSAKEFTVTLTGNF